MKAQEGKTYALIDSLNVVNLIFDLEIFPEWDENSVLVVELDTATQEWLEVGMSYDPITHTFIQPTLEEYKEKKLNFINAMFELEAQTLKDIIPNDERLSWDTQKLEAERFLQTGDKTQAPVLEALSLSRGLDINDLAQKVLQKNKAFNENIAKLIGNRQNLQKQIEQATNYKEVLAIEYVSPLGEK